jgi:hypothetical protein
MLNYDLAGATRKVGMDLIDVGVKCISLFLLRCSVQRNLSSSLTAKYFRVLGDVAPMATLSPYIRDSDEFVIPEELLVGMAVYYAQTNGESEKLSTAR